MYVLTLLLLYREIVLRFSFIDGSGIAGYDSIVRKGKPQSVCPLTS